MLRKLVMFSLLLVLILSVVSCIEKTDKYSKKNKEVVVDSVQVKMQALQDSLISYQKQARVAAARAEEVSAKCNSVVKENQSLQAENSKLRAQLAQARDEVIPAMRQQYENLFAAQQSAIDEKDGEIRKLTGVNWQLTSDNESLRGDNVSLQTKYDNLKPWASKWQKDSKRSFIKVMFGAGKAPAPDVLTPQLE